jgi:hypothetical protein
MVMRIKRPAVIQLRCERCPAVDEFEATAEVMQTTTAQLSRGWASVCVWWHIDEDRPTAHDLGVDERSWHLCPECWLTLAAFLNTRGSAASSGEL